MVFSSVVFLFLFLPLVLVLYFNPLWKGRTYRNSLLLIASLGFYAWGEPVFVFVMLASVLVNYLCGLGIARYPAARGAQTGRGKSQNHSCSFDCLERRAPLCL